MTPKETDYAPIIVERRELIGEVQRDPNGTQSMVGAAFALAADYIDRIAGSDGGDLTPISVEFRYAGITFRASAAVE